MKVRSENMQQIYRRTPMPEMNLWENIICNCSGIEIQCRFRNVICFVLVPQKN